MLEAMFPTNVYSDFHYKLSSLYIITFSGSFSQMVQPIRFYDYCSQVTDEETDSEMLSD